MKKTVAVVLVSACLVFGAGAIAEMHADAGRNLHNFQTIEVDNFDTENFWNAKFSKFRSVNVESTVQQIPVYTHVVDSQPENTTGRTESNKFLRWVADSDTHKVIPEDVRDSNTINVSLADQRVMGLRGNWDFPGYNWVIVEPSFSRSAGLYPSSPRVADPNRVACHDGDGTVKYTGCGNVAPNAGTKPMYNFLLNLNEYDPSNHRPKLLPPFVQLPGQAKAVDFWVWGKGYHYNMELDLENYRGNVYTLEGPSLAYDGWQNARVDIPGYIQQTHRHLPRVRGAKFLRFRIIANPYETPAEFYTYFDYMQVLTDLYLTAFPGDDLVGHPTWGKD